MNNHDHSDQPNSAARAIVRDRGDAHALENGVGGQVTYWARGEETGGALTVLETVAVPGAGPPLHVHVEDEFIYVIEGRLRFRVEDAVRELPAGSFVFIPRNVIHTWQSVGDVNARFLFGYAPEAPGMERFFERGAELPDDSRLAEAFSRFASDAGMEVVGPPLGKSHPAANRVQAAIQAHGYELE